MAEIDLKVMKMGKMPSATLTKKKAVKKTTAKKKTTTKKK